MSQDLNHDKKKLINKKLTYKMNILILFEKVNTVCSVGLSKP